MYFYLGQIAKKWSVIIGFAVLSSWILSAHAAQSGETDVLLLHSYHQGMSWSDRITEAVTERLAEKDISLAIEYLDSKRRPLDEISEPMASFLSTKYASSSPKIVLCADNNALTFLRNYHDTLFTDSQIIFCGINNYNPNMLEGFEGKITGVVEESDPVGTLRLVRHLQPEAKKIAIISGSSTTAKAVRDFTEKELASLSDTFEFEWWNELTTEELMARCSNAESFDAILMILFNRDANGQYYSYEDIAKQVTDVCPVPVYGLWDFYLNTGVVGGRMASARDQGKVAAQLCLNYLVTGQHVPVIETSPNATLLVYPDMMKHELDPRKVPADAQILNRPPVKGSDFIVYTSLGILLFLASSCACYILVSILSRRKGSQQMLIHVMRSNSLAVLGVTIFTILLALVGQEYLENRAQTNHIRNTMLAQKRAQIKDQVQQIIDDINFIRSSPVLDSKPNDTELKDLAKKWIERISYGEDGYLYAMDENGVMLAHPISPDLVGVNFKDREDANGYAFANEMIVKANQPGGVYVSYKWLKPSLGEPVQKLSFAKTIPGWNWIITTGIYLDDIEAAVGGERANLKQGMVRNAVTILSISLLSLILLLITFRLIAGRIAGEIDDLQYSIVEANPDRLIRTFTITEFATIAKGTIAAFNEIAETENRLWVSYGNFKSFFDSSSDILIVIHDNGNIVQVNAAVQNHLGWDIQDLIDTPTPIQKIMPKEDIDAVLSGEKASSMLPLQTHDGKKLSVETHFVQGAWDGCPVIFSISKDVSELRLSEQKFATAFRNNVALMTISTLKEGRFHEVNESFLKTLGYTETEVLGKTSIELGIIDSALQQRIAEKASDPDNTDSIEIEFKASSGETRIGDFSGQIIDVGGKQYLLSIIDDTTERKRAEKQIVQLSRAIEQSTVGVVITNLDGNAEYVNPKFCETTGYIEDEVIGKNPYVLTAGDTPEETYTEMWSAVAGGKEWRGEFHRTHKSGTPFWEAVSVSAIRDSQDKISHYLSITEDITEKKELESQLMQAQKLESVGQLAAGIAHEINTPIQFVSDNLRFLKDAINDLLELADNHQELIVAAKEDKVAVDLIDQQEKQLKDADTDYLKEELPLAIDQSLDGTDRVSKLVRAMKEFSHPGSTEMSSANLNDAIQTTIVVAKNEWKYVADIETNFAEDMPMVPCLVSEFNQVILNMIVNARDAIAETEHHGKITISTTYDNAYAIIKISDTGSGMPEAVQQRIFDPFFTTKEVGKGSGQGLAIAHNLIVKKHGGEIDVESEAGEGTTFEIKLPLEQETVAFAESA